MSTTPSRAPSYFYPRSPCGERLTRPAYSGPLGAFLSTLSLRRATVGIPNTNTSKKISIHALLAESDKGLPRWSASDCNFYPRSPCGERRDTKLTAALATEFLSTLSLRRATNAARHSADGRLFLSTLSLRRATVQGFCNGADSENFYPRSPCGERPVIVITALRVIGISIHALLAESDSSRAQALSVTGSISIHALLAESDAEIVSRSSISCQFLSTLSLRRATSEAVPRRPHADISIHALLAESDYRSF